MIAKRKEIKLAPRLKKDGRSPPTPAVAGATNGAIIPPANHATANWVKNSV